MLMAVKKFRAVYQRPFEINRRFAFQSVRALKIFFGDAQFFFGWETRQDRQVTARGDLPRRFVRAHLKLQQLALLELALDVSGVEQVQTLISAGAVVALGF